MSKWVDKVGKIDYNTPEIELLEYEKNFDEKKVDYRVK
jgi:hypothetical protein